ncbi:hypothetical protein [Cesiribacter sp. SM1]|uniref:hypothetical protein n=1 Tax=Cesiribacter sp. SM1 TaxID=2861196 RepID=UPI001CD68E3D|nr:hypothetical protein [Cesiribacter sp. SM1]
MNNGTDVLIEYSQQPLQANQQVVLTLAPFNTNQNNKLLSLEELHTRYYHLLIVSKDLSFFAHEHPLQNERGYTCPFVFPFGGEFVLYNDIKPVGEESVVIPKSVHVEGEKRAAVNYNEEKLEASQGELHARLVYGGSGPVTVELQKSGEKLSANMVEDYLGAKAHVVMIEVASKAFLHVHAMAHDDKLVLHTSFTSTGTYRVWIQLVVDKNLYTLDFTLPIHAVSKQGHHSH